MSIFEIILLVAAATILMATGLHLRRYRLPFLSAADEYVPTVSLLIPARNETHAVSEALSGALALDYPKLEIIVLDDGSQDGTREKIRSFAHDGIRFIQGKPLPEGWNGKNWACQQLSEAASGEYLLFCDMDVQLSSRGLNRLVRSIHQSRAVGCSLFPRLTSESWLSNILAPFLPWVIHLLRSRYERIAPAYAGLLLIRSDAYKRYGGFARYPKQILAELRIAHGLTRYGTFHFFNNANSAQFFVHKRFSTLNRSRIRYLLPLYRLSLRAALIHVLLVTLPVLTLFFSLPAYVLLVAAYILFASKHIKYAPLAGLLLPFACVWEFILLLRSLYAYARDEVYWRERPV